MYSEVPFYPCNGPTPGNITYMPMKELESYMHFLIEEIAGKDVVEKIGIIQTNFVN